VSLVLVLVVVPVSFWYWNSKTTTRRRRSLCHSQVSVVIITLNEELQIEECLEHVSRFNPPCKEIIVSDGGSTDGTISLVKSLITSHRQKNTPLSLIECTRKGRAHQMNAGSRACSGDAVMFIHADSRPPLDSVRHVRTSLSSPGTILGGFKSRISIIDGHDEKILWFPTLHQYIGFDLYPCLFRPWHYACGLRCVFGDQNIFCRRDDFLQVGGYDEELVIMEDVDLCLRMFEYFKSKRRGCVIERVPAWSITSGRRIAAWGSLRATLIHFRIGLRWFLFSRSRHRDRLYDDYHAIYTDDFR
jgi:glycosyltransferase involved in cell wall biosynthesis